MDAPTERLAREGVRNFGWATASHGTSRVLVFVSTLLLARLLTPEDFGVFAAALAVTNYLELALDLGVSSAVIYEQETGITARVHVAFTLSLAVSGLLCGVGVVAAPALARFFRVPAQVGVFRALAAYLLLRGVGQLTEALLKRDLQFKKLLFVSLLRATVRTVVSVTLAWHGAGPFAIVSGLVLGELAAVLTGLSVTGYRPRLRLNVGVGTQMLRYGLSVFTLRVLDELTQNSDYLVIGRRLGPTALGYYTMAFRLPELLITQVLWVFSSVAFPLYSKARSRGLEAFRRAMMRALGVISLFGFTVGTALALLTRDVVAVLLSSKWAPAATPMALIALTLACSSIGWASGDVFRAVGKPGVLLKLNAPSACLLVTAHVIAARHGITAVAWVHLVHSILYACVRLILAARVLDMPFRETFHALQPALCVVIGMVTCALPVRLIGEAGLGSGFKVTAAALLGGGVGLLLAGRPMMKELRALLRVSVRN